MILLVILLMYLMMEQQSCRMKYGSDTAAVTLWAIIEEGTWGASTAVL